VLRPHHHAPADMHQQSDLGLNSRLIFGWQTASNAWPASSSTAAGFSGCDAFVHISVADH
jgi:hypothetical protein